MPSWRLDTAWRQPVVRVRELLSGNTPYPRTAGPTKGGLLHRAKGLNRCWSRILYGPAQRTRGKLAHNGHIHANKLIRRPLPHHVALVQHDEPVQAVDGAVLVRHHNVRQDTRLRNLVAGPLLYALSAEHWLCEGLLVDLAHEVLDYGGGHRVKPRRGLVVHDDLHSAGNRLARCML